MNLIRKIKISKIANVSFTSEEKYILAICEKKLKYISSYVYSDVTAYINLTNNFIFEANHNSKMIFVSKSDFWDLIEKKSNYIEAQKIISYFIKKKYEHYTFFYVMPKYN